MINDTKAQCVAYISSQIFKCSESQYDNSRIERFIFEFIIHYELLDYRQTIMTNTQCAQLIRLIAIQIIKIPLLIS